MAQLLVRDLEDAVVQALRQKAAEEGTSVEEAHRRILRCASRALPGAICIGVARKIGAQRL